MEEFILGCWYLGEEWRKTGAGEEEERRRSMKTSIREKVSVEE